MLLAMAGAAVPRIFELTGVDRVIPSFTSLEEALVVDGRIDGPMVIAFRSCLSERPRGGSHEGDQEISWAMGGGRDGSSRPPMNVCGFCAWR